MVLEVCLRRMCLSLALLGSAFALTTQAGAAQPTEDLSSVESAEQATRSPAHAKEGDDFFDRFIDDEDGRVDFSDFLAKGGFIPVPIIITEPAVEGGYGLAAVFLSVPPDNPKYVTKTAIAAFRTGNGSRGFGGFRSGFAFDHRLNYRIGAGHGKINLEAFPRFAPGV